MSTTWIVLAVTMLAVGASIHNWRNGYVLVIVLGLLQDPMRKLTPGIPAYYILWAATLFIFISLIAMFNREQGQPKELYLYDQNLKIAWGIYIFMIAVQTSHGFIRTQSISLVILGILFYLGPAIATLISIGYAKNAIFIQRFIKTYVYLTAPVVLTVYLSVNYSESWPVLREIGSFVDAELIIYDVGRALKSYSGLFRVGEIAAWHAATCCMFILIMISQGTKLSKTIILGLVFVALIGTILLTGRRKMLMTLTLFAILNWSLLALFAKAALKQAIIIVFIGVVGVTALSNLDETSTTSIYLQRGKTVYGDAGDRLATSYNLFKTSLRNTGGLGYGVGVSSQGARYSGGASTRSYVRGLGEAGMSKFMLDLGIVGLFVIIYLAFRIYRKIYQNYKILAITDSRLLSYSISFSSILIVNALTFLVATQVYGDFYVLVILGIITGMLFSVNAKGLGMHYTKNTNL